MKGLAVRAAVLATIAIVVAVSLRFDLHEYLTLDALKERRDAFQSYYSEHRLRTVLVFLAVYIATTAASLPGATVLTLAGGALFGIWLGTALVSVASTLGATLAFLSARFVFRRAVQNRFADRLRRIDEGIERDGALYLFTLRLIPAFPFFIINLAMGLTPIKTTTFLVVSQIGMLPATVVYVNAGTQLAEVDSVGGVLSADIVGSFVLIALFPFVARRVVEVVKRRWSLRAYDRPARFDYDLVVIGAGAAGLVSAIVATTVRARVALIERHKMGGDCLNTGCVPSKALLRSAHLVAEARRSRELGVASMTADFSFADVMERVGRVIRAIEPHDSAERYRGLGADVYEAEARIRTPFEVELRGAESRSVTTRAIVVASGAAPFVPPIEGLADADFLTSETVWNLRELPARLVVLGGGPVGCELAQAFRRLGSEVCLVEQASRLLNREDTDVSEHLRSRLEGEGIRLLMEHRAVSVRRSESQRALMCEGNEGAVAVPFDRILVAVGRKPRVEGFGLEELGVRVEQRGTIASDEFLRTSVPNIYVCGDVAGPYQFTHTASHQAWYAAVNALFSPLWSFRPDYRVIPWCTFTDPEVARVGLSESEATDRGIAYEVTRYGFEHLDRAVTEDACAGFVKVLTPRGKDRILGATIVGPRAGELVAEYVLAMKHGIGLRKILGTIHTYPTLAESSRFVAGEWQKRHKPEVALRLLERYFAWRRR
jgi:pyruvate/2-oxoglutarate dehydrogenase complex dihydrolipoamide dehydrogenase (E3) component/uncharacterized membrane protein YdjX (TVP38/TMEM64 family)